MEYFLNIGKKFNTENIFVASFLFFSDKKKTHMKTERQRQGERERERDRENTTYFFFYLFFSKLK